MSVAIVTGSAGLIGAETVRFFHAKGLTVVGIDNDMRSRFFGEQASTSWSRAELQASLPRYTHVDADIRDASAIDALFARHGRSVQVVVHTAAQPSHDWAASDPATDFTINANGTLNLLEAVRRHCPDAPFIHCSTNKVYGDTPNRLPLVEMDTRWELSPEHPWAGKGIDETMSIDSSTHSLFGVSKVAGDLLVQEYGRYFGMKTACFRGGCLTGPGHSGAPLHGFLSYLVKCAVTGAPYTVLGYKGKQVRDNIHSYDMVNAFWHVFRAPRSGAVYNMGGSRHSNCSMLEAISICEEMTGRPMNWTYSDQNRIGDHIWWISDVSRFQADYPEWSFSYDIRGILKAIYEAETERSGKPG
ncbi:MAG: NAD-dependent epimerase/dehydratase family protein [Alphaproteobacteria bacterium]|nr:NAD-dependent epimerase/dehydratase family protein [Alphaproteobacteria bacterium]MBF0129063.1 NAD-dependent epimerase/dehydratase family protein [Alphaproteobacteria bacterium]